MKERRYDIDWLRVVAMLTIFLFHSTRFFGTEGWHLKNAEQSEVLFYTVRGLVSPWVMELFFLLSGVGTWYGLASKRARAYIWERVKRLLVPLYTVGLFVLLPIQYYFELFTNANYRGGFIELLPSYFGRFSLPAITMNHSSLLPIPFCGHLWFLQDLFLISLLTLPLLLYLKSEGGRRWIGKLAGWCKGRGGIFLFVIPLSLALIGFQGLFNIGRSWATLIWYAVFFVIGYMMAADEHFAKGARRNGWIGLLLWIAGSCGMGFIIMGLGYNPFPGKEPYSLLYAAYQISHAFASWSAIVIILGIAAKYLNANHKSLTYGNEAVLPFYLFHQTIILCVGWYVLPWDMGIMLKFMIIAVVCFPLIMVLYDLIVKRFSMMRFLFGMRPKRALKRYGN